MRKAIWWSIVILGLGLFALIIFYALPKMEPKPAAPKPPPPPAAVQPPAPVEPQIRYPVTAPPQPLEKPLPALGVSDATMRNALSELITDKTLIEFFLLRDFVRRVVATIDNLPREKLALRLMPVKLPGGKFLVTGEQGNYAISAENAARYAPYVRLAEALDTGKLVALYVRLYPLFQQAYQELGYPKGYFNDRLVEVIDHLLDAPEMQAPAKLVQPKVFYLYADPDQESRSAGQKILMRIGNDNAATIKAKLREIRAALSREGPKR